MRISLSISYIYIYVFYIYICIILYCICSRDVEFAVNDMNGKVAGKVQIFNMSQFVLY